MASFWPLLTRHTWRVTEAYCALDSLAAIILLVHGTYYADAAKWGHGQVDWAGSDRLGAVSVIRVVEARSRRRAVTLSFYN
jgi:hypothetical protein